MVTAAAFLHLKLGHNGLVLANPRANNGHIIEITPILDQSYSFFIGVLSFTQISEGYTTKE